MSLLDLLASVSPNEDGTPNALQRFSNSMNPQREMQKLQMQAQLMELQKQQQVQSALTNWAKNPQGGMAGLYGGLAGVDPSYLSKFAELTAPKTTTIGGKIVEYNPNMPDVAPKVVYSEPTIEEKKFEQEIKTKDAGKETLEKVLQDYKASWDKLKESNAVVSPEKNALGNLFDRISATEGVQLPFTDTTVIPGGQTLGRAFGTSNQTERDKIQNKRPLLLAAMKKAAGMTGQELNSNQELQFYLSALGNLGGSYETAMDAVKTFSKQFGTGDTASKIEEQFAPKQPVKTAINPQTGQTLRLVNGKWQ